MLTFWDSDKISAISNTFERLDRWLEAMKLAPTSNFTEVQGLQNDLLNLRFVLQEAFSDIQQRIHELQTSHLPENQVLPPEEEGLRQDVQNMNDRIEHQEEKWAMWQGNMDDLDACFTKLEERMTARLERMEETVNKAANTVKNLEEKYAVYADILG